jgi:hypothetical protein
MGRFDPRYTRQQTAAIVAAQVDGHRGRKLTARQAVAAAAAGELGLDPFEYTVSSARHYAGEERRKRSGADLRELRRKGKPGDRIEHLALQLLGTLEQTADRIQSKANVRGGLDPDDIAKAQSVLRAAKEAKGLVRVAETERAKPANGKPSSLSPESRAALAELENGGTPAQPG